MTFLLARDREFRRRVESRDRLIRFRFIFGVRARTLAQAKRVGKWSEQNDEELSDIKACGELFDLEACELKEQDIPSSYALIAKAVCIAAMVLVVLATLLGMWPNKALLQFTDSRVWFRLSPTGATTFNGKPLLSSQACGNRPDQVPIHRLTTLEVQVAAITSSAYGHGYGQRRSEAILKTLLAATRVSDCKLRALRPVRGP